MDECHRAVLISEVQFTLGDNNRRRTCARAASFVPEVLSSLPFDAGRETVVVAVPHVDIIADHNHSTMMILELFTGLVVNLFCDKLLSFLGNFQQCCPAVVVARRAENVIVLGDGCWNAGGVGFYR